MNPILENTKSFWENRWQSGQTGWDLGQPSPPIVSFFENISSNIPPDSAILIPGCGNAHEADFLLKKGFSNITLIDISPKAAADLQVRFGDKLTVLEGDFFEMKGRFDLIVEQTFFCAIDPSLRPNYVEKMASLLKPGGRLVGLLFDTEFDGGPPFGGNRTEYGPIFEPFFEIKTMEICQNSIPPRQGRELWVEFTAKK